MTEGRDTPDHHVDVAVVVVTYNSEHVIESLLDSLTGAMAGLRASVVVVDNGSTDRTREVLARRDGCRVVAQDNRGYAAGINRGIAEVPGAPAVLVLNPDVRLDAGAVPVLLKALDQPGVGIVAPRVCSASGELHHSLRRDPTLVRALGLSALRHPRLSEHVQEPSAYEASGPVDWALGAVLAVSRECLEETGPWDESYFLYSEETDFCLRARAAGFTTWYEPRSIAMHIGGASGRDDLTHTMQIVNRVRLYARRHGPVSSLLYLALTAASEVSWVLRGHPQSRAAVRALVRPSTRPAQLHCGDHLLPL